MSVATQLGLHDPDEHLLGLARARWGRWQREQPALRARDDLLEMAGWIRHADPERADEVLVALAEPSSP